MKITDMPIESKRKLLDQNKGGIFYVKWVTGKGEVREGNFKLMMNRSFSSGDSKKAQENTTAHKPEIFTVVEAQSGKWKKINLYNLICVKMKGQVYEFETTEENRHVV